MTIHYIPAYCPACKAAFYSGMALDETSSITVMENALTLTCPRGHEVRGLAGTYTVSRGLLQLSTADPSKLGQIAQIATSALSGGDSPAIAIGRIAELMPPEGAVAVQQLGAHDPYALLKLILLFITTLATVVGAVATAIQTLMPGSKAPDISINNNITIFGSQTPAQPRDMPPAAAESLKATDKIFGQQTRPQGLTREQLRSQKQKLKKLEKKRRAKRRKAQRRQECPPRQ